jgi:hypothetical protein
MTTKFREDRWVGLYIHIMKDGKIRNQGRIISQDGDFTIRRYSFLDGRPTDTIRLSASEIATDCRLYETDWEMRLAHCIADGCDPEWHLEVERNLGLSAPGDPPIPLSKAA